MNCERSRRAATAVSAAALAVGFWLTAVAGSAQIFVANANAGTIGEYTTSGLRVNAAVVSGLANPVSLALSGRRLFVLNVSGTTAPPDECPAGYVGEYLTSGFTVNASLVTGLSNPTAIAVSGNMLFVSEAYLGVAYEGFIAGYRTLPDGFGIGPVASLPQSVPTQFAVADSELFIIDSRGSGLPTIVKYRWGSGFASWIEPPKDPRQAYPVAIAAAGATVFVVDSAGAIGAYTTAGVPINRALVTNLPNPVGIAVSGPFLYVLSGNGTIGKFTVAGAVVNASLVTGLNSPSAIAVAEEPAMADAE
jgi:hypothetical protein